MSSQTNQSQGLPTWVTALILLLLLVGGGWGMWRYFEGGSGASSATADMDLTDGNVVSPPGVPTGQGFGRRQRQPNFAQFAAAIAANMPDGVMPTGSGYLIKAGTARLDIDRPNLRGDWRYRFSYAIPNLIPPDQQEVLRAARRVTNDPAAAQQAGVTADQIQQLRALGFGGGMVVDQPDRNQISTLFHAWLSATGRSATTAPLASTRPITAIPTTPEAQAAEQKLLAALADIGKRQIDPTRQSLADRASHIHAILGDGPLQKLKPPG
jgi:hypothetical protein